ncbi:hypothetical protein Q7P36_010884 [Cladosporium allicinum]
MTVAMSRRAALDTTEILEDVLKFLTPQTLFAVQSVSRQWRDLIVRSPSIQKKMFLCCQAKEPEVWTMKPPRPEPEIPVSEMRVLPPKFRRVSAAEVESGDWKSNYGACGIQPLRTPVALNPWLRRRYNYDICSIEAEVDAALWPTAYSGLHGSLRNAYLTDPPCKECSVRMQFKAYRRGYHVECLNWIYVISTIRSDKPLTLGDVMDRTLASKMWDLCGYMDSSWKTAVKSITLADKIDDLKKQDSLVMVTPCELKLNLKVNGTTNHALVLNSDQLQ